MRRPLLLVTAVPVGSLTACSRSAPAPTLSAPTMVAASASPTPVRAPVDRLPGEIARTLLTGPSDDAVIEDVPPGVRQVYVHAVCTGPAGSTMRIELQDGDAQPFGFSNTIRCIGDETTSGGRLTSVPRIAQVSLRGSSLTGMEGWAVLSTSARG